MADPVEARLDAIERLLEDLIEKVEKILREGTGRKPGRLTALSEEHGVLLRRILQKLENGAS